MHPVIAFTIWLEGCRQGMNSFQAFKGSKIWQLNRGQFDVRCDERWLSRCTGLRLSAWQLPACCALSDMSR